MKTAVISDIHGNLEAFTAVLAHLEKQGIHHIISLGDNIGYGPDPDKVMDLLARHQVISILGNHEMVICHPRFLKWFNPVARKSVAATTNALSPKHIRTIHSWETRLTKGNLQFVHGVPPRSPFLYTFQVPDPLLGQKLLEMERSVCFCGHTHELELIHSTPDGELLRRPLGRGRQVLDKQLRYLINVGSVGQPRDADKSAKLVIYDDVAHAVEVCYIPYPFEITAQKIRAAGLPESFARRLCP